MHKAIILGLFLISMAGCKPPEVPEDKSKMTAISKVEVKKLVPQSYQQTIRTFGVLEAAESVSLSSEFSAKVKKINFKEGQRIQAGHVMVELDKADLQNLIKKAEADLQSARAKLKESRLLMKRRQELFAQKIVSQEQMEKFETTLTDAEADYERAIVGLNQARNDLSRASIISPVSGKVVKKKIEVGEIAAPGKVLAEIQVTNIMRVVTHVTEQEINSIQLGSESIVTTPGVRGREYIARIESRGDEVDPATGNFPVKLTVENNDGLLKTGMTAVVVMAGLEVSDALLIPDSALVDRNRKRVVYRVTDGLAEEVEPVLAVTLTSELIPVLAGLSEGDDVIIGGLDTVVDGKKVEVIETVENSIDVSSTNKPSTNKSPTKESTTEEPSITPPAPTEKSEVQEGSSN